MTGFPWRLHININTNPNCQVKTFTETFLNVSNFIPNETKRLVTPEPPWISTPLILNSKNRLFNNQERQGYKAEDKVMPEAFRNKCQQAVETAEESYLMNLGNKTDNPSTPQKAFPKIINLCYWSSYFLFTSTFLERNIKYNVKCFADDLHDISGPINGHRI